MIRVRAFILYSQENEYNDCINSLKRQRGIHLTISEIAGLPNLEAHKTLYQRIMDESLDYDFAVKVDADMVFNYDLAILDSINCMMSRGKDHAVFLLEDYASRRKIYGMHFFTTNCKWELNYAEDLFVDPNPKTIHGMVMINSFPSPIAVHSPNPSLAQAWFYGFHRMKKFLQPDTQYYRIPSLLEQYLQIMAIIKHYKQSYNQALGYMLKGILAAGSTTEAWNKYTSKQEILEHIHIDQTREGVLTELSNSLLFTSPSIYLLSKIHPKKMFASVARVLSKRIFCIH
jgi:hypothetical protein